jgi:hypothetical protein
MRVPALLLSTLYLTCPQHARARRVFWRTSIAIGMWDDEVLNLPRSGRPSAITRSKSNRVWHEEWLYRWRVGGTSRLSFANGRLTVIKTATAGNETETPVSLTLRYPGSARPAFVVRPGRRRCAA